MIFGFTISVFKQDRTTLLTLLSIDPLIRIAVSLLPVFLFLTALVFLDSYRLVKLRAVLFTTLVGSIVSGASFFINIGTVQLLDVGISFYSRYGAPIVEELLKASYLVYLIRAKKIGFMVDGAIYGFAIGAGFAFLENIYYLQSVGNPNLFVWIVRGLGTAVMHGGTTAILGIISKNLSDRHSSDKLRVFLPGLAVAIIIHSFFNHFFFSPQVTTVIQLVVLPLIVLIVFDQSEKSLRDWLEMGLDTDAHVLEMIITGNISESRIGIYLKSLQGRFPGEVVADMLCLLRIHLELAIRAKGILLMREAGFRTTPDPEIKAKFDELKYLEKSIGKTGKLAILPFLHTSSRDLWQLHFLGTK
ncbi:MAG: PrsW family glutamic-type intramembrane protease [Bacteroidota bacterium]